MVINKKNHWTSLKLRTLLLETYENEEIGHRPGKINANHRMLIHNT